MSTPQQRLDEVTALIEAAGATVTLVTALASPDDVHTVVAHRVDASSPTLEIHAQVSRILREHQVSTAHLVPWIDPDVMADSEDDPEVSR